MPLSIRFMLAAAAVAMAASAAPAVAQEHGFLASPQTDLNRMYRVDRATGEVGMCQYAVREGTVGVTLCLPAGEGAGPQELGVYELVASRHEREGGVFRVEKRSGRMSICYVMGEEVVCTPQAR